MADPKPVNAVNNTPNKTQQITITCNELWSSAQQFSYLRLSDKKNNEYKLIGLYAARARRIAATYARFYLEIEEGGDKSKLGRYYWMALGAFASKTVACLLDSVQVQGGYFVGWASRDTLDLRAIANGLGQGNLWLFGDIAPAHWLYSHYPQHFFNGMDCIHNRHCDKLVEPVKSHLKSLPWAAKSLGKIKHFDSSEDLIEGFEYIPQIEKMAPSEDRRETQFKHLLAIANHEQGAVLQPLIYEDPDFTRWTAFQRDWFKHWTVRWVPPKYELVFTHECSTDEPELKSVAPDDLIIENFKSRMKWISKAAEQFHKLMKTKNPHMMTELNTIASWVNSPDAEHVY